MVQRGRAAVGSPTRIRGVVEPVVVRSGYELEHLTLSRAGRRHVVRVIVDSDQGINLDDVATLSRAISVAMDEAERSGGDLTAGEYTLEVSSPGIDRPLTQPRHWRRNVGRLIKVKVGERQVSGRLIAADASGVQLDLDGERLDAAYGDLGPGRVQIDFSRVAALPDDEAAAAVDAADEDEAGDEAGDETAYEFEDEEGEDEE